MLLLLSGDISLNLGPVHQDTTECLSEWKVFNKKRAFFQNKLTELIGKSKDLWKALKSLGLPIKFSSCEVKALEINNTVEQDVHSILVGCKKYYSTLAESLVKDSESSILTILKATKVSKAAGLGNLFGCFLKDGLKFLSKSVKDLCNFSISHEKFTWLLQNS